MFCWSVYATCVNLFLSVHVSFSLSFLPVSFWSAFALLSALQWNKRIILTPKTPQSTVKITAGQYQRQELNAPTITVTLSLTPLTVTPTLTVTLCIHHDIQCKAVVRKDAAYCYRCRRICDIYDFFAPRINALTYLLTLLTLPVSLLGEQRHDGCEQFA